MRIYPAIDLMDGKCVRLEQGQFESKKEYSSDPLAVAKNFQDQGATHLHVVDLDGAKTGSLSQLPLISILARKSGLKIQMGGGIRSAEQVESLLDIGVERIVLGSLAVRDAEAVTRLLEKFQPSSKAEPSEETFFQRFTLALDLWVKFDEGEKPRVILASAGWQQQERSKIDFWQFLENYIHLGVRRYLMTDIARDGMMTGPSFLLYEKIIERFPNLELIASGGISSLDDLKCLKKKKLFGAVVGKAFYENKFTVTQALKC